MAGQRERDGGLSLRQAGYVGADEIRAQWARARLAGIDVHIDNDQLGTFFSKANGDFPADAARGADDQRHLVFKTPVHASFCRRECLNVSSITATSTRNPWMTWVKCGGRPRRLIAVLIDDNKSTPA